MNPNNLLPHPAPSFDEPIEMLRACHERMTAQCSTLQKLAAYLPVHGADAQAQQAARNVMRYFDVAAPNHHADEEQDLFPLLIEAARRKGSPMGERIASLLDEHRVLESAWAQLRAVLADIAEGKATRLEQAWVNDFVGAHCGHMALEENQVFPFAEACLDRQQLAALSATMVARRSLTPQ